MSVNSTGSWGTDGNMVRLQYNTTTSWKLLTYHKGPYFHFQLSQLLLYLILALYPQVTLCLKQAPLSLRPPSLKVFPQVIVKPSATSSLVGCLNLLGPLCSQKPVVYLSCQAHSPSLSSLGTFYKHLAEREHQILVCYALEGKCEIFSRDMKKVSFRSMDVNQLPGRTKRNRAVCVSILQSRVFIQSIESNIGRRPPPFFGIRKHLT